MERRRAGLAVGLVGVGLVLEEVLDGALQKLRARRVERRVARLGVLLVDVGLCLNACAERFVVANGNKLAQGQCSFISHHNSFHTHTHTEEETSQSLEKQQEKRRQQQKR